MAYALGRKGSSNRKLRTRTSAKGGVRMRMPGRSWIMAPAAWGLLAVLWLSQGTSLHGQQGGPTDLPAGNGKELVAAVCTQCHALRLTTMQRNGRPGWKNVVERMVLIGMQLTSEETDVVVEY